MQDRWKVLAPVGLASDAEARVGHAVNVSRSVGGDLTLLYVIDNVRSQRGSALEWPANAMSQRRVVLSGPVAETVGSYADEIGADLVTLTGGPYHGWRHLWRRSTGGAIATSTNRPVCFAPKPAGDFGAILCCVALDGTDEPIVRFSEDLAGRCDATLVLLHVIPEVSEALLAYGIPGGEDRPLSREAASRRIGKLASIPHLTSVASGPAYASIASAAREHRADVVVTGRRNNSPSLGFDSGAVLARVPCPVISVPVDCDVVATTYRPLLSLFG